MLWYKAWQESRVRFTISAVVLVGFCLFATIFHTQLGPVGSGDLTSRIHDLIYSGTAKGTFAILSLFLGLGGLVRERSQHTSTFTLALPVTRLELMRTQISVGLAELGLLSCIPALLLPGLSRLAHELFPLTEALRYSLLWFVCGSIIFAGAYLLSSLWGGEYTAAVAGYVLLMLQALIASWSPLRPYRLNLMWTMSEPSAIPWGLLAIGLIATLLFAVAARQTEKQDF